MITLHTLGGAAIELRTKRLLPGAERAFACLLYLGVEAEAARSTPRAELQTLLYPDQPDPTAAHNLRQLLYKVRQLGAPIHAARDLVSLPPLEVQSDYGAFRTADPITSEMAATAGSGLLPSYAPTFSEPFADWLDIQRSRIAHDLTRALVRRLAQLRANGRWRELEPIARACLHFDPLNEEATLALAESLALHGQKTDALQLLDSYREDIGPLSRELRVPAGVLRRRISEVVPNTPYHRIGTAAFVGRDIEMAELWSHLQQAKRGEACAVVIHGEPGIGKTRLAAEFSKAAAIDGATCVQVECEPHDARRPMGVFAHLVPPLLQAPGGLGVSPEVIEDLKRLTMHQHAPSEIILGALEPRTVSIAILRAVADLIDAVAGEAPLLLWIDNAHSADAHSIQALRDLVSGQHGRALVVALTSRTRLHDHLGHVHIDGVDWLRLQPLTHGAARALAAEIMERAGIAPVPEALATCLDHAAGNPLYIQAAASDLPASATDVRMPRSLQQLLQQRIHQLDTRSLHLLAACAVLGRRATIGRVTAVLNLQPHDLFAALQDLHDRGMLDAETPLLHSRHPLLAHLAMHHASPGVLQLLHHRSALTLEGENTDRSNASLLWDCAQHWQQAGDPPRALQLLRSCAAHCVQIGQPHTACELLEHAEAIAPPALIAAVLEEAIAAAQAAERYGQVRVLIGRHRSQQPTRETHDDYELAEIEAARWDGMPLSERSTQLWECLSSPGASPAHRIKAASAYIVNAADWLDAPRARAAYDIVQPLRDFDDDSQTIWDNLEVVYQLYFGGADACSLAAHAAMRRAASTRSPMQCVLLATNAAIAYGVAGLLQAAKEAELFALERAKQTGMRMSELYCTAMLACTHLDFGDVTSARTWDQQADAIAGAVGGLDRALVHLSNKIEFAILAGDGSHARQWLELAAREYLELQSPLKACMTRGYDLLIRQLEGAPLTDDVVLDELMDLHFRARTSVYHDAFAEGLFRELLRAGRSAAAGQLMTAYVTVHRRERYPLRAGLRQLAEESEG